MTPRLTRSQYEINKGEGNRRAMKELVFGGCVPGVLGYLDGQAVAWCSIEPREIFGSLTRSRILRPVDDRPVWSIVCLFVTKDKRRQGLSTALIEGTVAFAASRGAVCVEAYPVEPKKDPMPAVFAYTGLASAFRAAGFVEVGRRSPTRPIMRREMKGEG